MIGDMVYLKLQTYRYNAFNLHKSMKIQTKYYGPFRVLEKFGAVAYKIQFPDTKNIQNVFHVGQLKKHLCPMAMLQANLPLVTLEGYIKWEPVAVLDTRTLPHRDEITSHWKIQWKNLNEEHATWEDKFFIKVTFPGFYHCTLKEWWPQSSCGQEPSKPEGIVRTRMWQRL
jgi:hypothetical protein